MAAVQQTPNPSADNVKDLAAQAAAATDSVVKSEKEANESIASTRLLPKLPSVAALLGLDNGGDGADSTGSFLPKLGKLSDSGFADEVNGLWNDVFGSSSSGTTTVADVSGGSS